MPSFSNRMQDDSDENCRIGKPIRNPPPTRVRYAGRKRKNRRQNPNSLVHHGSGILTDRSVMSTQHSAISTQSAVEGVDLSPTHPEIPESISERETAKSPGKSFARADC